MKFYLGVTDSQWFSYLKSISPEDVNFWQPGGKNAFKAIQPGDPFLFKLKRPYNAIGGVGFFVNQSLLPLSMAWSIFGNRNGAESFERFSQMIRSLRSPDNPLSENPNIGCIALTNPVFFDPEDYIETPTDWNMNIVQGKTYSALDQPGKAIWGKVVQVLYKTRAEQFADTNADLKVEEETGDFYGQSVLRKVRLGQGAFRVLITDTYQRRCAISGEKTLPVLEAAHIKPYSQTGPHKISNGLLLRSDIHKLFDSGYITVTPDLHVEVSQRIRIEYENGKDYYKFHGEPVRILPLQKEHYPGSTFLEYHNQNIYRG